MELMINSLKEAGVLSELTCPWAAWSIIKAYLGEDRTVEFDGHAFDDPNTYSYVLKQFARAFRPDLRVGRRDVSIDYNDETEVITLKILIDGEEYSTEWVHDSKWAAEEFFDFIKNVIEPKLPGRFVFYSLLEDFYCYFYVDNKRADSSEEILKQFEPQRPI